MRLLEFFLRLLPNNRGPLFCLPHLVFHEPSILVLDKQYHVLVTRSKYKEHLASIWYLRDGELSDCSVSLFTNLWVGLYAENVWDIWNSIWSKD